MRIIKSLTYVAATGATWAVAATAVVIVSDILFIHINSRYVP